ncbi:hypothetical protein R3P38DRAFT_3262305 [Favolaschia claudopus]|uniref:Uncharacterized protein n=1 Tax=Favolaschia claudopus TaxID=2862362 RepID=A0AAW0CKD8_9AGAR
MRFWAVRLRLFPGRPDFHAQSRVAPTSAAGLSRGPFRFRPPIRTKRPLAFPPRDPRPEAAPDTNHQGAQLKFWTTQTNASAEEKVLKIFGTVDQLRTNLAAYYGLDLTVIPRAHEVTVPTIDESVGRNQAVSRRTGLWRMVTDTHRLRTGS